MQIDRYRTPLYKIDDRVPSMGTITDIYGNQYEVDGQWYAKSIVHNAYFDSLIRNSSFESLREIVSHLFSIDPDEGYMSFVSRLHNHCTDVNKYNDMRERFKMHDKKVVSKFSWLISNVTSLFSRYKDHFPRTIRENRLPLFEQFTKEGYSDPSKDEYRH